MPSIRITRFAGLLPEVEPRLLREDHAQIAHNTLLWDGQLRPLPAWFNLGPAAGGITSLYPAPQFQPQINLDSQLIDAQVTWIEPYPFGIVFGSVGGALRYKPFTGSTLFPVPPIPIVSGVVQVVTPQNQSVYPIPRTYAVTIMCGNMESAPFVFPSIGGTGALFEGDVVTLAWTITNAVGINATGCRLYRTIPGFDTSEQIGNPKETAFHLVTEFNTFTGTFNYVDTQSADQILGDRNLTEQFGPILVPQVDNVAQTESGWLVISGYQLNASNTQVHVSERFLWNAWPLQNFVEIPAQVTDMVTFYDDVFFGTQMQPYHMRVAFDENVDVDSLHLQARPFPDTYACIKNTMVTTNFGAMYASPDGLVSLQINEDRLETRKVANPGDTLINPVVNIKIEDAEAAAWWNGFYIGFCNGVAYLFNQENNSNNQFPLGQLVTFTTPPGFPGPNIAVGHMGEGFSSAHNGLYGAWGNQLYVWQLPGYGYETATKLTYQWRSKTFVMPGTTTFAAAKVVNSADGPLTANFYGDGNLIYTTVVADSQPFRIPHNHSCINWEIELIGSASVQEAHLATSMRELTEEVGHP